MRLATIPPLAWPHRKSPAPSVRARRITACDSRESSKSNLQGNRPPKVKNQQIRLLQHTQSASPPKGFRILHGRLLLGLRIQGDSEGSNGSGSTATSRTRSGCVGLRSTNMASSLCATKIDFGCKQCLLALSLNGVGQARRLLLIGWNARRANNSDYSAVDGRDRLSRGPSFSMPTPPPCFGSFQAPV